MAGVHGHAQPSGLRNVRTAKRIVWSEYRLFFTNQGNTTAACCSGRNSRERGYFFAPNAVLGTLFILTTKLIESIHDTLPDSKILDATIVMQNVGRITVFRNHVNTNRPQGISACSAIKIMCVRLNSIPISRGNPAY